MELDKCEVRQCLKLLVSSANLSSLIKEMEIEAFHNAKKTPKPTGTEHSNCCQTIYGFSLYIQNALHCVGSECAQV